METATINQATGNDVDEFCANMTGPWVPTRIATAVPLCSSGVHLRLLARVWRETR